MSAQPLSLVLHGGSVSALLDAPPGARACYVMAHGAGAGMTHSFMAAVASKDETISKAGRKSIDTLRLLAVRQRDVAQASRLCAAQRCVTAQNRLCVDWEQQFD